MYQGEKPSRYNQPTVQAFLIYIFQKKKYFYGTPVFEISLKYAQISSV